MKLKENNFQDDLWNAHETVVKLELEDRISVYALQQVFYQHDKDTHGSLKDLLFKPEYPGLMEKRYDRIYCKINEVIESVLDLKRKDRQQYDEFIAFHKELERLDEGL